MEMAKTRLQKNGILYSIPVYGYIAPRRKAEMDLIRELDPHRFSNSQVVQDALDAYIPPLLTQLGVRFNGPAQNAPAPRARKRRRAV